MAQVAIRMAARSSGCMTQFPGFSSCVQLLQNPINVTQSKLVDGTLVAVSVDRYPAIIRPAIASAFLAEAVDL